MWRKVKNVYHLLQAVIASVVYQFPSRTLCVVGVTGTDGKTTTTAILYQVLKASGYNVAMISTVGAAIGETVESVGFHVTTPSPFALQKYLFQAKKAGVTHVILEVTSHALDQKRVWGISFAVAVVTNVTHEHLDYHNTYEDYVRAKAMLLRVAKVAIINADDVSYRFLVPYLNERKYSTYGMYSKDAVLTPKKFPFQTNLIGEFNRYNCLAAIAVLRQLLVSDDSIRKALLTIKAPIGRQDIVYDKDFRVIVDFAHTPNAFAKVLPEIRKQTKGRLIHVFGSAAKRDETKRPLMGKQSAASADIIVLTAEDPRGESIQAISNQIAKGIDATFARVDKQTYKQILQKHTKILFSIPDRKEAIVFALSLAREGDCVITTGKSHEASMNYGKGEEPWDEYKVIEEGLHTREG